MPEYTGATETFETEDAGALRWATQSDWDAARERSGVITRDLGVARADDVRLGSDPEWPALSRAGFIDVWHLDETDGTTAESYTGLHDATYEGTGLTLGADGPLGTNAPTLGGSDRVVIPYDDAFYGWQRFSAGVWVQSDIDADSRTTLFGAYDTADDNRSWSFAVDTSEDPNQLYLVISRNGETFSVRTATIPDHDPERWHHYSFSFDSFEGDQGWVHFYRNGVHEGSSSIGTHGYQTYDPEGLDVWIGDEHHATGRGVVGEVSHPWMINASLSESWQAMLYEAVADGGRLLTDTKPSDEAAIELETVSTVPAGTDLRLTVYQDESGGTTVDREEEVTLSGGTETHDLFEFTDSTDATYWIDPRFRSPITSANGNGYGEDGFGDLAYGGVEVAEYAATETPILESTTLTTGVPQEQQIATAIVRADTAMVELPVYSTAGITDDYFRVRVNGTTGAFKVVGFSDSPVRMWAGGSIIGVESTVVYMDGYGNNYGDSYGNS